tara:strand:+ start:1311 stop:2057 length:747 start_codon:yes stop_codon:yes gene_type:complete
MINNYYNILGCPCYALLEKEVRNQLDSIFSAGSSGYTVAINAEKILRYRKDKKLQEIIDSSILPYPDGSGAVLSLKWLHGVIAEKINMPVISLEYADENSLKTFIVGGSEANHKIAIQNIKYTHKNIELVGSLHGFHKIDHILKQIDKTKPELILLAMGSPLQEEIAQLIIESSQKCLVIGCGGALDIIAGKLKRAPKFWIDNNLEWLFRILQEPWRIQRQLFLPKFFYTLILTIIKKKLGFSNNRIT